MRLSPGSNCLPLAFLSFASSAKTAGLLFLMAGGFVCSSFYEPSEQKRRDSCRRARWETGDSQYSKPCISRHLNSDQARCDKSYYFTEQSRFPPSLFILLPGHFSLCVIVEFQPTGAALNSEPDTFVIWLNPICRSRRTCVKCAITARLPLSSGTDPDCRAKPTLRFRRHGMT